MENQKNEGPATVEEIISMAQQVNDLNQTILDRYRKIVEFIEEKELIEEFGIWVCNQQKQPG